MDTVDRKELELPLNAGLYHLEPEEKEFFDRWTGIHDEDELKRHILDCQAKAYAVLPYPCIRTFSFLRLKIMNLPGHQNLLKIGRERKNAIFVEFAACFGQELRKVVQDGFPLENIVATDRNSGFWELGHQLFNSTPQAFPVPFVPADIFNDTHLAPAPPRPPGPPHANAPAPPRLRHARRVLLPSPRTRSAPPRAPRPGTREHGLRRPHRSAAQGHAARCPAGRALEPLLPQSAELRELWDGDVYPRGSVSVEAALTEVGYVEEVGKGPRVLPFLVWCVTRV